jgi:hypothetical protein
MMEFIYLPCEEKHEGTSVPNSPNSLQSKANPLDPTHQDFDFSLWSKAVKARMNRVLQKRSS